jgi:hypothetical protein
MILWDSVVQVMVVTYGTCTVSGSDNVNDGDEHGAVMCDEQGVGVGGVSMKFVWQGISTLPAVQETFYVIHGPQFNISNLDIVDIYENIFDMAIMWLLVNETNRYTQQEI